MTSTLTQRFLTEDLSGNRWLPTDIGRKAYHLNFGQGTNALRSKAMTLVATIRLKPSISSSDCEKNHAVGSLCIGPIFLGESGSNAGATISVRALDEGSFLPKADAGVGKLTEM